MAAGYGLQGEGGAAANWDGVSNVHPVAVELAWSLDEVLKIWNIQTQSWLQRYVFLRAPRSVSRYVTYFASAFWHGAAGWCLHARASPNPRPPRLPAGFFPGYYLAFFTVAFAQEGIKRVQGCLGGPVTKKGAEPGAASKLGQWLLKSFVLNYSLSAFCLLDAERGLTVWRSLYYSLHVLAVLLIVAAVAMEAGAGKKPRKADAAAKPGKAE